MGCAQMEQLEFFVTAKRRIAERYRETLSQLPGISVPEEAPWASSTFWMYTILVDEQAAGIDSRSLLRALGKRKIQCRPLWQPMHHSAAHDASGSPPCPVADKVHSQALSLPCSVGLSASSQDKVIESIAELVNERCPAGISQDRV
jgi:perosamine synthetase